MLSIFHYHVTIIEHNLYQQQTTYKGIDIMPSHNVPNIFPCAFASTLFTLLQSFIFFKVNCKSTKGDFLHKKVYFKELVSKKSLQEYHSWVMRILIELLSLYQSSQPNA